MSERTGHGPAANDVQAIRTLSQRLVEAEMNGDVAAFAESLADDGVIMMPWKPPLEGRAACLAFIGELLPQLFAEYDRKIQFELAEVQVHGDCAFERGMMSQTLTPRAGGNPEYERYPVLCVFSRGADGLWKQARIIWNIVAESDDE